MYFPKLIFLISQIFLATRLVVIEERGEPQKISCASGTKLSIKYAAYGNFPKCYARSSRREVDKMCSDKASCLLVATNKLFGNPCKGVKKFLVVAYKCIKGRFGFRFAKYLIFKQC